ncbi:MAG: SHOCT domain-containing protein [Pirellulaceae bacterium]
MRDLLDDPMVVTGVALLVIAGGCAIVFCIARRFRDYTDEDQQDAQQLLANLKEMHLRGDITDEEFRVIPVANQIHIKANDNETSSSENSADETTQPGANSNNNPDEQTQP